MIRKYREEILLAVTLFTGTALWAYRSGEMFYKSFCDFESVPRHWAFNSSTLSDSISHSGNYSQKADRLLEYSATFSAKVNEVVSASGELIHASAFIYAGDADIHPSFIISLSKNDSSLFWTSYAIKTGDLQANSWSQVHFEARLPDFDVNDDSLLLGVYLWNNRKDEFFLDDFEMKAEPVIE